MKSQKTAILPENLGRVVFALLEDVDTPRSLTVKLLIEHGEVEQLLKLEAPPARYLNASDYFKDVVVTDLLRKCADLSFGSKSRLRDAAVETFYQAEKACKLSNDRIDVYLQNGPFEGLADLKTLYIMESAQRFIRTILGRLPAKVDGRHGPGATYSDRSLRTTVPDKMSTRPTITPDARCFLPFWVETAWFRGLCRDSPNSTDPETIRGNRFTTVRKDAMKDRGICIEPSINIFFQLGVGKTIRESLARNGIDLDNGQPIHQRVACEASLTGRFCTIDLSNASDNVSRKLVKYLLPSDWFAVLNALRSPFTLIDGKYVYLEKFSSMGNGFTFELETLIFLGLAMAVMDILGEDPIPGENVWVYGDDIIVPNNVSRDLLAVLRFCGFTPNGRKTFTSGYFRESCGGDFFRGQPVRAHFIKEFPDEFPQWIVLANGLRRVANQYDQLSGGLWFTQRAWFRTLDNIPSHIRRLRGPSHFGDSVIHDERHTWRIVPGTGHKYDPKGAWFIKGLKIKPESLPLERWGGDGLQLACILYGTGVRVTPRGAITSYGFTYLPVS